MNSLEKIGIVAGLALPALAGAWWAGSGYVEFNDRLAALEAEKAQLQEFLARYEKEQALNSLINDQVKHLAGEVEWLKFHHHHMVTETDTGRAHVD